MAPTSQSVDDFTFIMTCLKHAESKPKVNFEEVAKETGAKSSNTCYQRHWGIMRKWGLAGGSGKGRQPASASPAKATTSRKRKAKDEEGSGGDSPAKKAKATPKKKAMQPKVEEVDFEDEAGDEKETIKAEVEDEDQENK